MSQKSAKEKVLEHYPDAKCTPYTVLFGTKRAYRIDANGIKGISAERYTEADAWESAAKSITAKNDNDGKDT